MKIFSVLKNRMLVIALILGGLAAVSTEYNDFEISKNLELFANIYRELNTHYVDEVDPEYLMETGINAMLKSLDPYTTYIPADQVAQFNSTITGRYGGLGVSVIKGPEHIIVSLPYEGAAGQRAGLRVGDKLLEIDGESVVGATMETISHKMRGRPGTSVRVKVARGKANKVVEMTVEREEIKINNTPYHSVLDGNIGYIVLQSFSEKAGEHVAKILQDLKQEYDLNGVILDLRGNTGGLLTEAVNVANVFLEKNRLIVQIKGRNKALQQVFRTLNAPVDTELPLAVLIDQYSASASEIVAGAIQDLDRGVIVGQRSFGKGLVQNTRDLNYGAKVKLTTARYYIPSGRCIQALNYNNGKPQEVPDSLRAAYTTASGRTVHGGGGITPDVAVDNSDFLSILATFRQRLYLFDFAEEYQERHQTIPPANQFMLTDADFEDFLKFLDEKGYAYQTETELLLDKVEQSAKGDHYLKVINDELDGINTVLKRSRQAEVRQQKARILQRLQRYIAARYYYERGALEAGIQQDPEIAQARQVLATPKAYQQILAVK